MDGSTATWDPVANTLDGQACTDPIGPERYERWLDCFTVAKAYDEHHHEHPTAIARKFELAREMPEAEVEQLLIDLLSAPIRGDRRAASRTRWGDHWRHTTSTSTNSPQSTGR